ncbi:MAG: histidine kinase dimerization/phospho-acceptor domain-containing protein, partial [Chloroflexota bacterium]
MQTEILTSSIFGLLIIAEVIIIILTWLHRDNPTGKFWFTLTLIPVIGATALHLLPADFVLAGIITRDYLIWLMLIMAVIAFGGLALRDLANDNTKPSTNIAWMALSGLWLIAFAITGAISNPIFTGWGTWLDALPLVAGVTGGIGFVLYSLFLLGALSYSFYRASMPEIANRVAFWIVTSGAVLLSVVIVATGITLYAIIGTIALYVSMFISLYGVRTYRLVDVRDAVLRIAQSLMVVLLVWVLVFATLYFLTSAQLETELVTDNPSGNIVLFALLSAVVAIAIVPARQVIRFFFSQLGLRKRPNLAQATAQYSQLVAKASTIEEVVNATTETLNRVMGVRRSALILINNTVRVKDSVELIVLEAGASLTNPTAVGYLHEKSPIYYTFAEHGTALGQFDMDYSPAFKHTAPQEKTFFRDMQLSVYVPISADNRLIGLVATGAKLNDTTYTRDDIETLTVIGQQVGTALRSARLIDDLQHLNDSMRVLNKRLENAKVELEKLDNIKTDFITIASHELRTPLAQIRGYTDILDSLNKANALKEGQADQLVGNLRKSTERMEELISAMLDVSQIDVNSMDLRFIRT